MPTDKSKTTGDEDLSRFHPWITLAISIFRAGMPTTVVVGLDGMKHDSVSSNCYIVPNPDRPQDLATRAQHNIIPHFRS